MLTVQRSTSRSPPPRKVGAQFFSLDDGGDDGGGLGSVGGFAKVLELQTRPDLVGKPVKLTSYGAVRERFGCELVTGDSMSIAKANLLVLHGLFAESAMASFAR